jgi:putative transposase
MDKSPFFLRFVCMKRGGKQKLKSCAKELVIRTVEFLLLPNAKQEAELRSTLDLAWELRNELVRVLTENRHSAKAGDVCFYKRNDFKQLVSEDNLDSKYLSLHSQVRQDLVFRVWGGNERWLESLKTGGDSRIKPPRERMRKKFRSITYSQFKVKSSAGKFSHTVRISKGKAYFAKLGEFKVKGWRKLKGEKKTATIIFKQGGWFLLVTCAVPEAQVCRPFCEVAMLPESGVDPGVMSVVTDSYGNAVAPTKPLKAALGKLKHLKRDMSRKFEYRKRAYEKRVAAGEKLPPLREIPYSNRLQRCIRVVAKAYTKVEVKRTDAARKVARKLERTYSRVAVEEHGLQFMFANRRLARTVSDVAIGKQKQALRSAFGTKRYVPASNRRAEGGNSQTCLCGFKVAKKLSERWHLCPRCGVEGPRDQVSAIICQYETFGTLPELGGDRNSGLGLSRLKGAVSILEQGRGENKCDTPTQSCPESDSFGDQTVEFSVKRLASRLDGEEEKVGAGEAASIVVKTTEGAPSVETVSSLTEVQTRSNGRDVLDAPTFGLGSRSLVGFLRVGHSVCPKLVGGLGTRVHLRVLPVRSETHLVLRE